MMGARNAPFAGSGARLFPRPVNPVPILSSHSQMSRDDRAALVRPADRDFFCKLGWRRVSPILAARSSTVPSASCQGTSLNGGTELIETAH